MKSGIKGRPKVKCKLCLVVVAIFLFASITQAAGIVGYWGTGNYLDVQVSGSTAVCAANGSGIDIFDISNPANPALIANFDTTGQALAIAISGTRVYVADGGGGLQIIDISNPSTPNLLGIYNIDDISPQGVYAVGTTVYVVTGRNGLKIIDAGIPASPTLLGSYRTVGNATDIFVVGSTAYIVEENIGFEIVDVSTPATPQMLSRIASTEASGVWVEGDIACFCVGEFGFTLYNISNPARPQRLQGLSSPATVVNNAQIVGSNLYLTDDNRGLQIVDISDPNKPTRKSSHEVPGTAQSLAITGTTALVAGKYSGLNLINIANSTAPVNVGSYDHSGSSKSIWVADSIAYLAQNSGGLQIIDISNPVAPRRLGHLGQSVECVQTVANKAYVSGDYRFSVFDISNPAKPTEIGNCYIGESSLAIDINADTAYIANGDEGFRIIDISNPTEPKIISTYSPGFGAYPKGIKVVNNIAYVCCSRTGLHIVDVNNPQSVKELGIFDTPDSTSDVDVVGSTAYVADGWGGLQIINVMNPAKPVLLGEIQLSDSTYTRPVTSVKVIGTNAYVTNYSGSTSGALKVVDISDPTHPQVTKTINISGLPDDFVFTDNKFFVADSLSGRLSIIELTDSSINYKNSIFFPHAACTDGWTTEIALINSSSSTIQGYLSAYDNQGQQRGGNLAIALKAYGRHSVIVNNSFSNASSIAYLVFRSNSQTLLGYTKFQNDISGYRVALPTVTNVSDSTFYVSHIASNDNWWTGIALLNTTNSAKTLTITFSDGRSKVIGLAANEHKSLSIRNLFAETMQSQIDSAIVTGCTGVAGFEIFGSIGNSRQLSGISLSGKTAKTIYYPHIATDQNWWTGIAAFDPAGSNRSFIITPYSKDGDASTEIIIDMPPLGSNKYLASAGDIGLPADTAWLQIDADFEISGFELFGNNPSCWLAGYTGVGLESKKGIFAKLDQGSSFSFESRQANSAWTGIALINSTPENTTVLLTARNDDGDLITATEIPLNPHERLMGLAETIFSGKDIGEATYISYESQQKLVGFQINGDGCLIDALPALKY